MKQKNKKKYLSNYNIGLDRYLLNDKYTPNYYMYGQIRNGLNSSKNIKNNSTSLNMMKKSSSYFFPDNNISNISMIKKNNNQKSHSNGSIHNIKSFNINKRNNYIKFINSSNFLNRNTKSVPKEKRKMNSSIYTNSIHDTKRAKTPILNRNDNGNLIYDYKNDGKNKRNNKFNFNVHENKSFRNYNNIFQPINIFSQFKRNKQNNNDDMVKNSLLFKKFLDDELKKVKSNTNKNNNRIKKNKISAKNKFIFGKNKNKSNIINENNVSSNIVNNTNDTTPISSGNLYYNKLNNSQILSYNNKKPIFDNNIDCNEINFHIEGVSSGTNLHNNIGKKRKKFKGKKIKCIHDLSKTGLAGDDKKVNQDNYFIFKNFVQGFDNIYMGVCDGHGYYGHEVSGYIKENLPMDLNHLIKTKKLNVLKDDLSAVIKNAFILENKSLLRNRQIDSDLSGSTCVSVIYTPIKLIIANIGDSRCVLGKCIEIDNYEEKDEIIGEKKKRNIRWVAENLSRDHKPSLPEEAERILKVGGRIRPMKDEDGEFIGPLRVYMKEKDMPGLAMTRSFGDYFGSTAGVISEPEVTEYFFKPEDKFMVLASDGLFEFMESQEVIDIIKDYYERNDIVGCCEYLYKESTRKWIQEEEDTIDDITIILVFFEDLYDEVE